MYRVAVIGGGPSGSVAAAFLAQQGAEVTLIERERFPRHHVGESLQPASFQLLDTHLFVFVSLTLMIRLTPFIR